MKSFSSYFCFDADPECVVQYSVQVTDKCYEVNSDFGVSFEIPIHEYDNESLLKEFIEETLAEVYEDI